MRPLTIADRITALAARVKESEAARRKARESAAAADLARREVLASMASTLAPLEGAPTPWGPLRFAVHEDRLIALAGGPSPVQLAEFAPAGQVADCFAYIVRWFPAPGSTPPGQASLQGSAEALHLLLDRLEPYLLPEPEESPS